MNKFYDAPIQVDSDGELIFVFPDELMMELDWNIGDTLRWQKNDDDSWTLTRHEDSNTQ